jgi:RNA polymerase sigma-70 factor (ECF subfamily)
VDADQLKALRDGSPAAFDAVYAAYRGRIYNFLYRLSGRRDVADDLFQETWLKLARHAASLRDDTDLGAWLFTVARNAYLSHRRWSLVERVRRDQAGATPETWTAHKPGPDRATEARRELDDLERALAALPPSAREVLLLVGVEGLGHDQAAAVLGTTPEALRQRLSRARSLLAERLQAEPMKKGAVR